MKYLLFLFTQPLPSLPLFSLTNFNNRHYSLLTMPIIKQ